MSLVRAIAITNALNYYYEKDPIFDDVSFENTKWHGKAAEELDLTNSIHKEDFESVLKGQYPKSKEQLVQNGVNNTHRAGLDFVFSAPKSVSIQALHAGDQKLIEAHNQAVENTIKYVESIAQARQTENGNTEFVKTGNVVAASFNHSVSRSNDPQLHSHVILANMTKTDNGWKALSNEVFFWIKK